MAKQNHKHANTVRHQRWPSTMIFSSRIFSSLVFSSLIFSSLVFVVLIGGCGEDPNLDILIRHGNDQASQEAVFNNVADLLNGLDQASNIKQFDMAVVFDRAITEDEKDVLATLEDNHFKGQEGRSFNIDVPTRNTLFQSAKNKFNRVRKGDLVYYYLSVDTGVTASLGQKRYVEFRVQQVISEFRLHLVPKETSVLPEQLPPRGKIVIWRESDVRLERNEMDMQRWLKTGKPSHGWEPTPDKEGIEQLVSQLNHWIDYRKAQSDSSAGEWSLDQMVTSLPEDVRTLKCYQTLEELTYLPRDGRLLQESIWLRDVARQVPTSLNPLKKGAWLADWTVRNVQLLDSSDPEAYARRPWQALVAGHATAEERAWVFVLLARQLNLQAVKLELPAKCRSDAVTPCWVGLVVEKDLFLFDMALGLPIPGASDGQVATLSQVLSEVSVLRRLDLPDEKYPVTSSDLMEINANGSTKTSQVVARIEMSPLYLAKRMRLLELQLRGSQRLLLSFEPSGLEKRLKTLSQTGGTGPLLGDVGVWGISGQTDMRQQNFSETTRRRLVERFRHLMWMPYAWKGRVLQFRDNPYITTRNIRGESVKSLDRYHDARKNLLHNRKLHSLFLQRNEHPQRINSSRFGKMLAGYWLGMIAFEKKEYELASDWFGKRTLRDYPDSVLKTGARYNLARANEMLSRQSFGGELAYGGPDVAWAFSSIGPVVGAPAISNLALQPVFVGLITQPAAELHRRQAELLYRSGSWKDTPQHFGNLLRAQNLSAERIAEKDAAEKKKPAEEKQPETTSKEKSGP